MNGSSPPRRALLVSFSGIDGAGKTTQIERLSALFSEAGIRVRRLRFWEDVAVLAPFRQSLSLRLFGGDPGVGAPDNPVERRDKNVHSPSLNLARCFLYLFDAIRLRILSARLRNSDCDMVIFDRHLYDELANLPLQHRAVRVYLALLGKLLPPPDIAFLLDANPAEARIRKPEYPLEFLYQNRAAYLALSRLVGMITVSGASESEITRRLLEDISIRLAARSEESVLGPSLSRHLQVGSSAGESSNQERSGVTHLA